LRSLAIIASVADRPHRGLSVASIMLDDEKNTPTNQS
jgi:hypothetical protein